MANLKKFKVIFVEQKKKDGTSFTKMLTILKKNDGTDLWVQIKFGDDVNTKVWKNKNQIVSAENKIMEDGSKNIRIPKSFEPYTNKNGKTIYPYIYIQQITNAEPYQYKGSKEDYYVDADAVKFALDEEETDTLSQTYASNEELK